MPFRCGPGWRLMKPPIGYIAYIDEAGDDGIKKIRTETEKGGSEWLVISALVIHAENEPQLFPWLKEIIAKQRRGHQLQYLHFHKLDHTGKISACSCLAEHQVYLFSRISNKINIENYVNKAAEKVNINKTARFYAWMSRLLLEQISNFIAQRTYIDYGHVTKLRVEFSDRGGLEIKQFRNYFDYLRSQSLTGTLYIDQYDLDWSVIDTQEMHSFANKDRAGLQLADTVASAFYCGLEKLTDEPPTPEYARLLEPRMARDDTRRIYNCGVKFMPRYLPDRTNWPLGHLVTYYAKR
jgi:Protein of unknown function (DUF3800)